MAWLVELLSLQNASRAVPGCALSSLCPPRAARLPRKGSHCKAFRLCRSVSNTGPGGWGWGWGWAGGLADTQDDSLPPNRVQEGKIRQGSGAPRVPN